MSLSALNQQLHEAFLSLWEEGLAALFALSHARAQHCFDTLALALSQHQASEDRAFAAVSDWPKGSAVVLLEAEHRKLEALLLESQSLVAALAGFAEEEPHAQRLVLTRYLDPMMRLKHLLEHHGLREQSLSYPHLEMVLSAPEQEALAHAHRELLTSLKASLAMA